MAFAGFDEEQKIVHCICLFVAVRAHSFITATDEGLFGLIPRINAS